MWITKRPKTRALKRARSALSKLFGFGSSVLLLALVSFAVIPAMVAASGQFAWGAIALGQSIGGVASVLVGYGWGLFGPATVANASATSRRSQYVESVTTRVALFIPIVVIAATLAGLIAAPDLRVFAISGAIASTAVGLSSSWYFVGVARPYGLLIFETLPRVAGSIVGIALMLHGRSAVAGVISTLFGFIFGFIFSTMWILWSVRKDGAEKTQPRRIYELLREHRNGVVPSLGLAGYDAAPTIIVSIVTPAVLPTFALANKVLNLITTGLKPIGTVVQSWVPQPAGLEARVRRARIALTATAAASIVLAIITASVVPALTAWLGRGQISLSCAAVVMTAVCISLYFFKWTIERAVLATFRRLTVITRSVAISAATGLPFVAIGGNAFGATGALAGVCLGLAFGTCVELYDIGRTKYEVDTSK